MCPERQDSLLKLDPNTPPQLLFTHSNNINVSLLKPRGLYNGEPHLSPLRRRLSRPWPSSHLVKVLIGSVNVQCHWIAGGKLDPLGGRRPLGKVRKSCAGGPAVCGSGVLHWWRLASYHPGQIQTNNLSADTVQNACVRIRQRGWHWNPTLLACPSHTFQGEQESIHGGSTSGT